MIHYPRISNFTDFDVFEQMPEVSVRYVTNVRELGTPDLIFLPGSKNTMGDLKWMRQNGLEAAVKRAAGKVPIFGICGGYQMLGCEIADPDSVEEGGQIRGMELLPVRTVLQKEKHRCQTDGTLDAVEGIFSGLTGCEFTGYEIHMGQTVYCNGDGSSAKGTVDEVAGPANGAENVVSDSTGRIYGSYIHGLFDKGEIAGRMIQTLARKKASLWRTASGRITALLRKDNTISWQIPCGNICVWRKSMECSEKPVFHNYTGRELAQIRITPPDEAVRKLVKKHWDTLAKPLDGMGGFETITAQIGAILGTEVIDIRKRVCCSSAPITAL